MACAHASDMSPTVNSFTFIYAHTEKKYSGGTHTPCQPLRMAGMHSQSVPCFPECVGDLYVMALSIENANVELLVRVRYHLTLAQHDPILAEEIAHRHVQLALSLILAEGLPVSRLV